ncbi:MULTISPECIES: cation diffusion facilitator family transporter [Erythrobacteraceae]|jgi:cation diffusion facilitator family transporter|uniref:Cation diffusion facilitator family transporter n=1 Tax=Alteraurantiacibacter buctensis TaxID=1503981 RepID=A0A844Z164_9SPHN|nr:MULTISPECIES: cation diffusion facilitator family transporter [Erythrobacteraceae]MCB5423695.1 cation transporter [Altererythrobacter sp. CC-YST694]MXO73539.1 cation diffusion facilitator family transporter [Alteraurantiacibacter buctensis]PKQ01151.1 MAG: RND transporter [Alphaproteobacteria bacterium HGW-Alphaproteobacteria-13]
MSGEGDLELDTEEKRRTLWIVLWLNVAIAIGFFITGVIGDSNALLANGLDNSSDAVVYALSLLALSRSRTWKRGAARFSGIMLLIFAGGVIADAIRRFVEGSEPGGIMMMAMAAVAAIVNLICLRLLNKMSEKDVNLRAATTFSFNDFISNGGIIIAAIIVMVTGANWPDLVVGIAVAGIALYGGIDILRDAHMDIHDEDDTEHEKGDQFKL